MPSSRKAHAEAVCYMLRRCFCTLVILFSAVGAAGAEGIVSRVTSAPIFANGIVRDVRAGINIFLQTDATPGDQFLDPAVPGYGIPPGGMMEIELEKGYQRDPSIKLDDNAILLVAGTPQQGLPGRQSGFVVEEGDNENTFRIIPNRRDGLEPAKLISPAPGAAFDPIRQHGIKIIHIGRVSAFVSRGEQGVVAVRILDSSGNIIAKGQGSVDFLPHPVPRVFPTNIPHDQRNHNWQRLKVNQILGVASNTLPLPVILYERNEGLGNKGIVSAGVLSREQLADAGYDLPKSLEIFTGGLILKDTDGDGFLHPQKDIIIGGITIEAPENASGYQLLTPMVGEAPFLSLPTVRFNERAGKNIGGAIMQSVFIAGDTPGLYRIGFALLTVPGDPETAIPPEFNYVVVVEE